MSYEYILKCCNCGYVDSVDGNFTEEQKKDFRCSNCERILFEYNKNKFLLHGVLTDFAIQWYKALKYKKYDEWTLQDLEEWIMEFLDNRIIKK